MKSSIGFVSLVLSTSWFLAACATPVPPVRTAVADVLKAWGQPTATYALQPAGQRLEYATGPFGRTTWMIDIDADGRVSQARQVLNEAEFMAMQQQGPLTRDGLLRRIGTPGERRGARFGGETWSWRYPTNDCLWFQVSLDAAGMTQGGAFGIDPVCDARDQARD
ncbi:MAG: hypothetical protein Q8R98_07420 [Rubrivivax sp.]|nr:hypothetical protein [Rubrivivax sp.]MDP3611665.1 hypothetical protein [Rubrivivax sp.]